MKKAGILFLVFPLLFSISCKKDEPDKKQTEPIQKTQQVNLKIDNYVAQGDRTFLNMEAPGDEIAVTLGPLQNTYRITHIQFLFGGTGMAVSRGMTLKVYRENGTINPGALLHSKTHTLVSNNVVMQEIDVTDDNIVIEGGGSIRVGFEVTDQLGFPCFAYEENGNLNSQKNWLKIAPSPWGQSLSYSVPGNFVIRAVVQENI